MKNNRIRNREMDQNVRYELEKKEWHRKRESAVAIQRGMITVVVFVLGILFTLLMMSLRNSNNANASEAGITYETAYSNVTVEDGDTLWSIASAHTDGSTSQIRSCIEEMKELNSIGYYEGIRSGDRLIVPTYTYAN